MKMCKHPDCDRKAVCKGCCDKHYRRILKNGSIFDPGARKILEGSAEEKFHKKYEKDLNSGCWIWKGSSRPNSKGVLYPRHTDEKGRSIGAHRFSYLIHKGSITDKYVCHKCDNPMCVNPDHLVAEDHLWNMKDMKLKGRSYTGRGENANRSILSNEQAKAIYNSELSQSKIAKRYGVSQKTVSRIKRGETYSGS